MGIDLDQDVEEVGWNKVYQENDRTFDNSGCGPNNIPAETTELKHFVDLFLDNEFQCTLKIRKIAGELRQEGAVPVGAQGSKG